MAKQLVLWGVPWSLVNLDGGLKIKISNCSENLNISINNQKISNCSNKFQYFFKMSFFWGCTYVWLRLRPVWKSEPVCSGFSKLGTGNMLPRWPEVPGPLQPYFDCFYILLIFFDLFVLKICWIIKYQIYVYSQEWFIRFFHYFC